METPTTDPTAIPSPTTDSDEHVHANVLLRNPYDFPIQPQFRAGATVSFSGYGIGQAPEGAVESQVTALGVNY